MGKFLIVLQVKNGKRKFLFVHPFRRCENDKKWIESATVDIVEQCQELSFCSRGSIANCIDKESYVDHRMNALEDILIGNRSAVI